MNTRTPADIFTSALERLSSANLFEREVSNDEHTLRRESSGAGPSDCARMVCSCCDWCGPWREQSDEFMSSRLLSDARGHREDVEQRWLPIGERAQADGGNSQ